MSLNFAQTRPLSAAPHTQGKRYLSDPATGQLYEETPEGWVLVAGTCVDGHPALQEHADVRLYTRLDEFLRNSRMRLRELFDAADTDRSGALDRREASALLRHVMPGITAAEEAYFAAQVDADGDGVMTFDELVAFLSQARSTASLLLPDRTHPTRTRTRSHTSP